MYRIHRQIIGKASGNFRPYHDRPEIFGFLDNLEHQINLRHINKVYSPHCQLTTNLSQIGRGNDIEITNWFIRTTPGFDGAMINEPGTAIAIFNADCPAIIMFDRIRGKLILLHGGFRCLVPENRRMPNIIERAFDDFRLDPNNLETYIGFGIGPCCYGIEHMDKFDRPIMDWVLSRAVKGPRKGQISLDLFRLAKYYLMMNGVPSERIIVNNTCTACYNRKPDHSGGDYYSNTYEGSEAGRNVVLAWLAHTCTC